MIVKILAVKAKPFKTDEGDTLPYFWTKAENPGGFVIQFGTPNDYSGRVGEKLEIALEQSLGADGKSRYKEVKL